MATLTQTDFATQAGHWYAKDGTPAYTVTGKNGKERNTTLRDARELGLYPSVTSILQIEAKPQLTNWLVNQAAMACVTLPRLPAEDDDSFLLRALQDGREQANKARERGTYLHGLLEKAIREGGYASSPEDVAIIEPVLTWLSVNFHGYKWNPERSFACSHGYGGKLDLHGTSFEHTAIIDYKFKADIIEGKRLAYDEHATQLGAYANGLGKPRARCINLFISSTIPGLIVPVEHSPEDIDCGWEVFKHLLAIWKLRRGL